MLTIQNPDKINWALIPKKQLLIGNALDALITFRYGRLVHPEVFEQTTVLRLLNSVTPIFNSMEVNGLDINKEKLDALELKISTKLKSLKKNLASKQVIKDFNQFFSLKEFNPSSPKQMNELFGKFIPILLFAERGDQGSELQEKDCICDLYFLDVSKKTGKYSFSESNLKKLKLGLEGEKKSSQVRQQAISILNNIIEYKHLYKLANSYILTAKKLIEDVNKENKLYCKYNLTGTVTGRISCAAMKFKQLVRGISMHTLPADSVFNMRSTIVPSEEERKKDWVFVTVDYSTVEMRVVAHFSQDPALIEAFQNKEDLHSFTAAKIFNKPIGKVTKKERGIGKTINFTILYGGGAFKVAEELGITPSEGKKLIKDYYTAFPKLLSWKKKVMLDILNKGYVTNFFGRKRRSSSPPHSLSKRDLNTVNRQLINSIIQSSASDILLVYLSNLDSEFKLYFPNKARIIATVHDSIEFSMEKESFYDFNPRILTELSFINRMKHEDRDFEIPLECEVLVGRSFGENIEAKYDATGLLNKDEIKDYLCKNTF